MISNFVRGFIDGALSTLGVLIGASAGEPSVIISAGLGGTIANGISNILGAFSAEKARRYGELRNVERAMVRKSLKHSFLDDEITKEVREAGIVDGVSTILGGAVPIVPYFILPPFEAMLLSVGIVLLALLFLGAYLGKISKEQVAFSAIKMAVFGAVVAVVAYLIQYAIVPAP